MLEGATKSAENQNDTFRWGTLNPGEMIDIPPGTVQALRNFSERPAKCLLSAHARVESFFLEVAAPLPSATSAPTEARLNASC